MTTTPMAAVTGFEYLLYYHMCHPGSFILYIIFSPTIIFIIYAAGQFYKWRSQGSEWLSNMVKVTELTSGRAGLEPIQSVVRGEFYILSLVGWPPKSVTQ